LYNQLAKEEVLDRGFKGLSKIGLLLFRELTNSKVKMKQEADLHAEKKGALTITRLAPLVRERDHGRGKL